MPSSRPDPRRSVRAAVATLVVSGFLVLGGLAVAPSASAAPATGASSAQSDTTTSLLENCAPGHIVRLPNCGREPASPTDPGGWLQVSLFFLICGVILLLMAGVWWRSRSVRRAREADGTDPVSRARARGQGVRRSTRNEPVEDSSSKRPEATAGR
jgi:hypothetical protein